MELMRRRRELMGATEGEIPSGYRRVDWIENGVNGATYRPYIDTGIPITADLVFRIDFQGKLTKYGAYIMGQYADNDGKFYIYVSTYFQTAFGTGFANSRLRIDNIRHEFTYEFRDGMLHVTDKTAGEILTRAMLGSLPITSIITAGNPYTSGSCRTFSSKMWRDGELIQNLVPCVRSADSKPGMYDTVTKTFFTNAGTGEFVVPE